MSDFTVRDMMMNDEFVAEIKDLKNETELGDSWRAFIAGKGVTSEQSAAMLRDLLLTSGYFDIAPANATSDQLQRREGRREIMARILYLSDLPGSYITRARRAYLDELQKQQQ